MSGTQAIAGTTSASATVQINGTAAAVTGGTNFSANIPLPAGTNVVTVAARPTAAGTAPAAKRYQVVVSGTLPTQLTYDANGNTLTDENGNTYKWDVLNRLKKITYPSGASSWFSYDGLSRRTKIVEKNASGTVTSTKNFLWIGSEIAEERDASNAVTKRFFAQGEQQAGTNYYYTRDHLGSVREMTDSSGTIQARYDYDPYGRTTLVSGSNLSDFQYAGMYMHQPSGLNLTMFRAYDPNTGRWIGRDPIGEDGGINLYGYCLNGPLDLTDLLGLDPLGHHYVPTSIAKQFSQRVQDIWDLAKNRLDAKNYKAHNGKPYNGVKCRDYAKAVGDKLKDFLKSLGKSSANDLTDEQLQEFADEIKNADGEIGAYNEGVAAEIAETTQAAATATETVEVLEVVGEVDETIVIVGTVAK